MKKNGTIVSYSMDEIKEMIGRGEDKTDYDRVVTYEEIEAQIAADPELTVEEAWEDRIIPNLNFSSIEALGRDLKRLVSIRYSPRVIDYFKSTGKGWQTRMDAVLLAYVDEVQKKK
jgi:uncharacterized protein (DUF4415 family)